MLLYFDAGREATAMPAQQELLPDRVYDRRKHWLAEEFASLTDKHRRGVPPKLTEAQREQLRLWASTEALTARQLLTKLKDEFDVVLHPNTLGIIRKTMHFVRKGTRHSLKRDELRFRKAQREITDMLAAADRREIPLGYCDEAGFAPAHRNRSAWTPVGLCHTCDAVRGKRLDVVGALMASGELFSVKLWETMTALLFAGFPGLLMQHVVRPLLNIRYRRRTLL